MRGMFTCGVIDVLLENGIEFDGAVGVSAGAAFGCNYKSRQIGRALRYNTNYCRDPRYCGFRSLIKTGNLFGAEFCYKTIPEELDPFDFETFEDNPMEFYVVATELQSGKAVYHKCEGDGKNYEWYRASASMPLVSTPVEIDGKLYLDGGIADSVPIKFFESIGYDRNVIILTQPEDYRKKKNKLIPLMRRSLKKYPKTVETMARRHTVYNDTLDYIKELEKSEKAIVIRPESALNIGRVEHDPERLKAVYDIGRKTALHRLDEIKKYFEE